MAATIINGTETAQSLRKSIKQQIQKSTDEGRRAPGLAVIKVGDDPASAVYVNYKKKACAEVGINSFSYDLGIHTTINQLTELIDDLNHNEQVDGILVQLPLPEHLDADFIIERIDPDKDVDGFHAINMGQLAIKQPRLRPCTPKGVMTLLAQTGIEISGKDAVVIGASNIVGRPMFLELLNERATVTVCHSKTKDLASHVRHADILVVAVGIPNFIPGDWIKKDAVIIDVGINRLDDGSLVGDVDFDAAKKNASWITPVPGGVGPMTIASLLENTLMAYERTMAHDTD